MRKYELNGTEVWTREFGTSGGASASAVVVDYGGVYVVGREGSNLAAALDLDGFSDPGGGFLAKLDTAAAVTPGGPRILPDCIVNAASYVGGGVAPGEIVTLFGSGMGSPDLVSLQLTDDRRLATTLAGTRIFFRLVPSLNTNDRESGDQNPGFLTPHVRTGSAVSVFKRRTCTPSSLPDDAMPR